MRLLEQPLVAPLGKASYALYMVQGVALGQVERHTAFGSSHRLLAYAHSHPRR